MVDGECQEGGFGPARAVAHAATEPAAAFDGAAKGWLRLVMDSMSEGFGLLAPDVTTIELNTEAMRLDKRPRETWIGRSRWTAHSGT